MNTTELNETGFRFKESSVRPNSDIKAELIAEAMATNNIHLKEALMSEANSIPDQEYKIEKFKWDERDIVCLDDFIYKNSDISQIQEKSLLFDSMNDFAKSNISLLCLKSDSLDSSEIDQLSPTIFDTTDLVFKFEDLDYNKNLFYFKPSRIISISSHDNKTVIGLKLNHKKFNSLQKIFEAEKSKPIKPSPVTKKQYELNKKILNEKGKYVKTLEEYSKDLKIRFSEEDTNARELAYIEDENFITIFLYVDKINIRNILENYTSGNGFEILFDKWILINNIKGSILNTIDLPIEIIYQLKQKNPQQDFTIIKTSSESLDFKAVTERPILNANIQDLTLQTPKAWDAIVVANSIDPVCFNYGGKAVRLRDDNGRCTVDYIDIDILRDISAKSTDWKKGDNDYNKSSFPPTLILKNMLVTECPLPKLTQVTETPYFSKEGKLVTQEKYNSSTGIFFHNRSNLKIKNIPSQPTSNELYEAKEFLKKPFSDFPFSSNADFTNAVALVLTPFIKFLISGHIPMFGIIAPDAGTGKTLLFKTSAAIYSNNYLITTAPRDQSEWHRKIFSLLLGSNDFIDIDNVNTLDSEALSTVLTSPSFSDRLLGKSTIISVPNNSIFVFTGNNPVLSKELTRRTVFISLDAKSETPWNRNNFQIKSLNSWILSNREKLITSILTIIQSWISAGKPLSKNIIPIGSFEEWSIVMAGILEHVGYNDFLGNSLSISSSVDIESNAWHSLINSWNSMYGTQLIKTSHIFNIAVEIEGLAISGSTPNAQKKSLGIMLKKQSGRVYGDWQIHEAGTHQGAILWKLEKIK